MDAQPALIGLHDPSAGTASGLDCTDAGQWVRVERYWLGEIVAAGGGDKVRVGIGLVDTGLISIDSGREFARSHKINRPGKPGLVRVSAEYNLGTRAHRNARLPEFEEHRQTLDEPQLRRLTESGARAWRDVPNASAWVDSLRGGAQ